MAGQPQGTGATPAATQPPSAPATTGVARPVPRNALRDLLAQLDATELAALNLIRGNPTIMDKDIAAKLGLHKNSIWKMKKRQRFKLALAEMLVPARDILTRAAPNAAKVLENIINGVTGQSPIEERELAVKAAKVILKSTVGDKVITEHEVGKSLADIIQDNIRSQRDALRKKPAE